MSALAHEALSPAAQRADDKLHELLALKLVDALAALEAAKVASDDAHKALRLLPPYEFARAFPGDKLEKIDLSLTDARVEAYLVMGQLGLDARKVGEALA